jgi:hypothetical protein
MSSTVIGHSEPLNALKMEDVMQEIWDLCTDLANVSAVAKDLYMGQAQEVSISSEFGVIQVCFSISISRV